MAEQAPAAAAEARDTRVAVVLAVAAIVAAALGAQATLLSSHAAGKWQGAVRLQVKNGSFSVIDSIDAFEEVPVATLSAGHLLEAQELAATKTPLLVEVAALLQRSSVPPVRERPYVRSDGSFDLTRRLADLRRASTPADVAAQVRAGDEAAHRAWLVSLAILPAALAFLAAAVAKAVPKARRPALVLALVLLAAAAGVELAADLV